MSKNYIRPLSNMDFPKSTIPKNPTVARNPTNPKNPTVAKDPTIPKSTTILKRSTDPIKYSLRQKNVDRMSKNQIEAVMKRNEELEQENKDLKVEVEAIKGSASDRNKGELPSAADKEVQVSMECITIAEKGTQTSVVISMLDKATQIAVLDKPVVAPKGDDNLVFDYLPWLNVVHEENDFYSLENQLVFSDVLQSDLIATAADKVKAPDEETFMKYFLARVFSRDFFVNKIAFNARGSKVQFKNTILLRCFALSLAKKFEKPNKNEDGEVDEKIIEQYQRNIQDFMTSYKVLVKKNPNNWVR